MRIHHTIAREFQCNIIHLHEKTGIITADESLRPSMKAFGTFVKQNVSCLHVDLIGVSLKIFDDDRPWLRVLRVVNVENATDVSKVVSNAINISRHFHTKQNINM